MSIQAPTPPNHLSTRRKVQRPPTTPLHLDLGVDTPLTPPNPPYARRPFPTKYTPGTAQIHPKKRSVLIRKILKDDETGMKSTIVDEISGEHEGYGLTLFVTFMKGQGSISRHTGNRSVKCPQNPTGIGVQVSIWIRCGVVKAPSGGFGALITLTFRLHSSHLKPSSFGHSKSKRVPPCHPVAK